MKTRCEPRARGIASFRGESPASPDASQTIISSSPGPSWCRKLCSVLASVRLPRVARMTENVATAGTLASFRRRLDLGATWPFVLFAWTSSRLLFLVVGVLSHAYMAPVRPGGYPREPSGALNYWAHWDGGWFSAIAQFGYDGSDALAEPLWPSSANFFPLYPITI